MNKEDIAKWMLVFCGICFLLTVIMGVGIEIYFSGYGWIPAFFGGIIGFSLFIGAIEVSCGNIGTDFSP